MPKNENPAALAGANGAVFSNTLNEIETTLSPLEKQEKLTRAALKLARRGLPVYPVTLSKAPACRHGFKDATTDEGVIRKLFYPYRAAFIGVATGAISGIDVLDLDIPRHSEAAQWYEQHRHLIPATRTHQSISGGLHLLFKHADGLRCSTARPVIGVDVRANGGGIVWWPAVGCPIIDASPLATWPDWLLAAVKPTPPPRFDPPIFSCPDSIDAYARATLRRAFDTVATAPSGTRNQTLNSEAWSLMRFVMRSGLSVDEICTTLAAAALSAGLDAREIAATLASVIRARGIA